MASPTCPSSSNELCRNAPHPRVSRCVEAIWPEERLAVVDVLARDAAAVAGPLRVDLSGHLVDFTDGSNVGSNKVNIDVINREGNLHHCH